MPDKENNFMKKVFIFTGHIKELSILVEKVRQQDHETAGHMESRSTAREQERKDDALLASFLFCPRNSATMSVVGLCSVADPLHNTHTDASRGSSPT